MLSRRALVSQSAMQAVASAGKVREQLGNVRVIDRSTIAIAHEILLADIGNIGAFLVLGQQVVERLVPVRTNIFGDGFVPFLAVGKHGIDIEYDTAKPEKPVTHDVANSKARLAVAGCNDPATGLGEEEF